MSKKVYCLAQFLPKDGQEAALFQVLQQLEPNTLREDGCLQYLVTRQIQSPFAAGNSYPIVFNEVWADLASFEAHCQRNEIKDFFQTEVAKKCIAIDVNSRFETKPAYKSEIKLRKFKKLLYENKI